MAARSAAPLDGCEALSAAGTAKCANCGELFCMLGFMRDKMVRRSLSQLNQSCMSVYSPVHEPVSRYCSSCEAGFCADCSNKVHATKFMAQHCVVDSKQQVRNPAAASSHCKMHPGPADPMTYTASTAWSVMLLISERARLPWHLTHRLCLVCRWS